LHWINSVNFKKINSLFNIEGDHNISGTPRSAVLQSCTLTSGFLLVRGLLFSQVNFSSWDDFDKFDNNPWITWVSCCKCDTNCRTGYKQLCVFLFLRTELGLSVWISVIVLCDTNCRTELAVRLVVFGSVS